MLGLLLHGLKQNMVYNFIEPGGLNSQIGLVYPLEEKRKLISYKIPAVYLFSDSHCML